MAALSNYQLKSGTSVVSNAQIIENKGFYAKAQYSFTPQWVTEAGYQDLRGSFPGRYTTVIDKDFRVNHAALSLRYRLLSERNERLAAYIGAGLEREENFRFTYQSGTSQYIVNRPFQFDKYKISVGAEYRSYYRWRGRFDFSWYQTLASRALDNGGYSTSLLGRNNFLLDGMVSHVVTGNLYMGVGLQYCYQKYDYISNELGALQAGSVTSTQFLSRVVLGLEQ